MVNAKKERMESRSYRIWVWRRFILYLNMENVKIIVFVPLTHSNKVREAIGKAGGGNIGNYSYCSFSSIGTGRFNPNEKANPSRLTNSKQV